jgi:subtilisin family serine protease
VPGQYIVVFHDDVANPADLASDLGRRYGFTLRKSYQHALKGFAGRMAASVAQALAFDPDVALVEPDLYAHTTAQQTPKGVARINAAPNLYPLDCANVGIAIIDTGIDLDHPDLNVVQGRSFLGDNTGTGDDDNGHGSHVAGTTAARNNDIGVVGVCPGARLWAIKVLDSAGNGYFSDIIEGIDYVTANAGSIEVANMSLGGVGYLSSLRTAIQNSVAAGVVYVVAAGNYSNDIYGANGRLDTAIDLFYCSAYGICPDDFIPAAYPEVAAISAMVDTNGLPGGSGSSTSYGPDDSFASFSNHSNFVDASNPVVSPGRAIDLLMPGVSIYSTWKNGGYNTISGTSMASPHAAGLAARYIVANSRAINASGVYAIRQALINEGVAQNSPYGLYTLNDPDPYRENIGWVGPSSFPTITINNVSVTEGNSGTTNAVFAVSLSASSTNTITVDFATANGSATAGSDYAGTSGTLTFAPGTTSQTITVQVNGDTTVEPSETFLVNLSNPTNATIAAGQGTGTITNNDSATIAINDVSKAEGNSGSTAFTFNVTLTGTVQNAFSVNFATANGSATSGTDYTSASGALSFGGMNPATQQITVNVTGDTSVESDETFFVNLTGTLPAGVSFADSQGVGTITNDDVAPPPPTEVVVFFDSFEGADWNGLWTQDSQNDWFLSSQRATNGSRSAEVDGSARDAKLTSKLIDNLQGYTRAKITFDWYIESGLDAGEYIAFDVSTDAGQSWVEKARLRGDVDPENAWHKVTVDMTGISSLQIRFRGSMSLGNEDANVDNVKVVAY